MKVHNLFDPTVTAPDKPAQPDDLPRDLRRHALKLGTSFVPDTMNYLANLPDSIDLRRVRYNTEKWRQATRKARESGVDMIICPRLPADTVAHRHGSPHLLIRYGTASDGKPGYVPVVIFAKHVMERTNTPDPTFVSRVNSFLPQQRYPLYHGQRRAASDRITVMLAHYYHLLNKAGWLPSRCPTMAGIIGTDTLSVELAQTVQRLPKWMVKKAHKDVFIAAGESSAHLAKAGVAGDTSHCVLWVDLNSKSIEIYSKAGGGKWNRYSPLQRYDHEFRFRVAVAEQARKRRGLPDDPPPRVEPIINEECATCKWWQVCNQQLDENDLSRRINKGRLNTSEITALHHFGITSVDDLTRTDLDELLPELVELSGNLPGAEDRLRMAAHRAQMLHDDLVVQRISETHMQIPAPGFEIDWDIESDRAGRVYLWGFYIHDAAHPDKDYYRAFSSFEHLDDQGEWDLATQAMSWLLDLLADHPTARVYHYSDYEMTHIHAMAQASEIPILQQACETLSHAHFDLYETMRTHFFGVDGLGLKALATKLAHFHWRDENPDGLNSQLWFVQAADSASDEKRELARTRILEYNEDDTLATLALRRWLRSTYPDEIEGTDEALTRQAAQARVETQTRDSVGACDELEAASISRSGR